MQSDIKFLLLFLVIALVILMYYQHSNKSININDSIKVLKEKFTNNGQKKSKKDKAKAKKKAKKAKKAMARENKGTVNKNILDNLINDINVNNGLIVNGKNGINKSFDVKDNDEQRSRLASLDSKSLKSNVDEYERESNSINKAPKYRTVSYKSSGYRGANFGKNENKPDNLSELDKFLEETNVFSDTNENNSSNYGGYDDNDSNLSDNSSSGRENNQFAPANIKTFQSNSNSQKDKIMNLYNSDNYLPNKEKTNPDLAKGFQILDNPVDVSNPNLIPVLKSIPVSSTLGSKRNSTYDIRSEPPNPKTTISPFLNSDIMPDIYATNRGCL